MPLGGAPGFGGAARLGMEREMSSPGGFFLDTLDFGVRRLDDDDVVVADDSPRASFDSVARLPMGLLEVLEVLEGLRFSGGVDIMFAW